MQYKENVLNRIGQSFVFMKNNFVKLFIPLVIFYLGAYYGFKFIGLMVISGFDVNSIFGLGNFNIFITIIILGLFYLILEIGIILGLFKTISDIDGGKEIDLLQNYKYGFLNIFNAFKTYFYIFMYVYLIPSLVFIIGGVYFIYIQSGNIMNSDNLSYLSNFIGLGGLVFLVLFIYIVYRSYKVVFAIPSAVSKDTFNKENFKYSVSLTKGNWWRIIGNFLLILIIVSLLSGIINSVIGFSSTGFSDLITNYNNIDYDKIFESFRIDNSFSLENIIKEIIGRLIMILSIIFTSIFTYIFYKRLEEESNPKKEEFEIVEEIV